MDNQNPLLNVPPPRGTEDKGPVSKKDVPGDNFRHLILTGELYSNFIGLLDRCADHLNTTNVIEDFLGHEMLVNNWRIWRIQGLEVAYLNSQMAEVPAVVAASVSAAVLACRAMGIATAMMNLFSRLETAARRAWHLSFRCFLKYRSLSATKRTQSDPPAAPRSPPTANRPETQNEPRTETTRQTNRQTKETPCNPQPQPATQTPKTKP